MRPDTVQFDHSPQLHHSTGRVPLERLHDDSPPWKESDIVRGVAGWWECRVSASPAIQAAWQTLIHKWGKRVRSRPRRRRWRNGDSKRRCSSGKVRTPSMEEARHIRMPSGAKTWSRVRCREVRLQARILVSRRRAHDREQHGGSGRWIGFCHAPNPNGFAGVRSTPHRLLNFLQRAPGRLDRMLAQHRWFLEPGPAGLRPTRIG